MNNNNIDNFFKTNIRHEVDSWNKEDAWDRLYNKRKTKFRKTIITISMIIVVLISLPFLIIQKDNSGSQNILNEFQKRQKLLEIELNLSRLHGNKFICENCYGNFIEREKHLRLIIYQYD